MTAKTGTARNDGRAVAAALQAYADRGVFRGFSATRTTRRRTTFEFSWLLRRPMLVVFDAGAETLVFPSLFDNLTRGSAMVAGLDAIVAARMTPAEPAHKRFDGRRARVRSAWRAGAWSVAIVVRGTNHGYAVQRGLVLVNDLFVYLHEHWPDYLIEHFGLSPE